MGRRAVRSVIVVLVAVGVLPSVASADEPESHAPNDTRGGWVDLSATAFLGDGLRFNNPYRLATILGSSAESLSRTAVYADVGATMMLGDPSRLAHGLALRTTVGLEGVP